MLHIAHPKRTKICHICDSFAKRAKIFHLYYTYSKKGQNISLIMCEWFKYAIQIVPTLKKANIFPYMLFLTSKGNFFSCFMPPTKLPEHANYIETSQKDKKANYM